MRIFTLLFIAVFCLSANESFSQNTVDVFIWEDLNGDGFQDPGEPGINGVTVELWEDTNMDGVLDVNTMSVPSAGPNYVFSALPDGDFGVVFYAPPTLVNIATMFNQDGADTALTDGNNDSDVNTAGSIPAGAAGAVGVSYVFNLTGTQTQINVDGGFFAPCSIGDLAWEDLNGNGQQEVGEPGLGGMVVDITDCMGNPVMDVNGVMITAGSVTSAGGTGAYLIDDLPPGDYLITFTPPSAPDQYYLTEVDYSGGSTDATDVGDDSDPDPMNSDQTHCITLTSGEDNADIDAGAYLPASVGNFVWHDSNADGIQDPGEPPLDGIEIQIRDDMGGVVTDVMGNPVNNIFSGVAGDYLFDNLPPGDYQITFILTFPWQHSPVDAAGGPGDAADAPNDSDGAGPSGETHVFALESDEEEEDIDVGVWQFISLGGTIWIDDNENCILDAGEGAASGAITMFLYEDMDDNGMTDPADPEMITTSGDYCFDNVVPGSYIIEISASEFIIGGDLQLFGSSSCGTTPDPDGPGNGTTDIDNDDNGFSTMDGALQSFTITVLCGEENGPDGVENKTVDFGLVEVCGVPAFDPASTCDELENPPFNMIFPMCDEQTLDAYCASMNTQSSASGPSPLCPNGGGFHNTSWFSFVAGSTNISIELIPMDCAPGGMGLLGIQAGIYTDCTFSDAIFCQSNCSEAPITVNSGAFVPGSTYYFFLDGCAGSVCDYEVNVNSGEFGFTLPNPTSLSCDLADCNMTCPSSTPITFTVENQTDFNGLSIDYFWSITPPVTGFITETTENTNSVVLDQLGTYTICMDLADNGCDQTDNAVCQTIEIIQVPDEMFMDYFVCEDGYPDAGPQTEDPNMDGNVGWAGPAFTGPGFYTAMVTVDGCNFNQNINVFSYPVSPTTMIDTAFCSTDGGIDLCGTTLSTTIPAFNCTLQDVNGCDSLIIYEIIEIDAAGQLLAGDCINGALQLTTDMFTQWVIYDQIDFCYTNGLGGPVVQCTNAPSAPVSVNQDGDYYVEVSIVHNGVTCSFNFGPLTVVLDDLLPPLPDSLNWPLNVCEGETGLVFAIDEEGMEGAIVTWSWPNGAVPVDGLGTTELTLDWGTAMTGDICVMAQNTCGMGPELCATVTFTASPVALFTTNDSICVSGSASVEYDGVVDPNQTYIWDFNGGAVISGGPDTNGPGPFEVQWGSSGEQPVGLIIELNGCSSPEYMDTIDIIDPLLPPSISCAGGTSEEVSFNIGNVNGAIGYDIVVTSGQNPGTLNGNIYTVGGLSANEDVVITVTTIGPAPCGNSEVSVPFTCTAQDCVPPMIEIESPMASDTICIDGSNPFQLDLIFDDPNVMGSGEFTGDGISTMGIFDPATGNEGVNNILYSYETDEGCFANATFEIFLVSPPPNDFSVSEDTICISDEVVIQYTGGVGLDNYIWTVDEVMTDPNWGTGPFNVAWTTTGTKTITLFTERFGCPSPVAQFEVVVEPELEAPQFTMCDQTTNSVEFSWNPVANATEYEVIYNGGSTVQTGTTYFIDMLNPDDMVTIEVIAISDNYCPNVSSFETCTATDCLDRTITFNIPDTTICSSANVSTLDIDASIDGGSGGVVTEGFSGTAVDPNTGVFDPNVSGPGTFTIYYNYQEDNCPYLDSVQVTIVDQPQAIFVLPERICVTETADLLYTGDQGQGYDYLWNFDGANIDAGSGQGPYTLSWDTPGMYEVSIITDNNGCESDQFSLMIEVEPELVPVDIMCAPTLNSVGFSWPEDDCATSYNVTVTTNSGTQIFNQTDPFIDVPGLVENEEVTISVETVSGCECGNVIATDMCTAQACPPITLDLSTPNNDFCLEDNGAAFDLDVIINGGDGITIGQWSGIGISNAENGTFEPMDAGVGTHTLTYNYSQDNCDFSNSIDITIFSSPTATVDLVDPECYDSPSGCLTVNASGGDGSYTYFVDGNVIASNNECDLVPGDYEVMVEDGNGCNYVEMVSISAAFVPSFELNSPLNLIAGTENTVSLDSNIPNASIDSIEIFQDGVLVCSGTDCLNYAYTAEDDDVFIATIYFDNACSISAEVTVSVDVIEVTDVYIPTIFSPNGDGFNDTFGIFTDETVVAVNSFFIFDRWGEQVFGAEQFLANDPAFEWDGTFKGEIPIPGVYVYYVEYVLDTGELVKESGDITLVR